MKKMKEIKAEFVFLDPDLHELEIHITFYPIKFKHNSNHPNHEFYKYEVEFSKKEYTGNIKNTLLDKKYTVLQPTFPIAKQMYCRLKSDKDITKL